MGSEGTVSGSDKGASALACPGRREAIPIAEGSDQLPVARVPDTYLIVLSLTADAVQTLGTAWAQHSWLHDGCLKNHLTNASLWGSRFQIQHILGFFRDLKYEDEMS